MRPAAARDAVRAVLAEAGLYGWVHARPITVSPTAPGECVDVDAHQGVPAASVYKLVLAVAWCRQVDDGIRDPRARVTVDPAEHTAGPTGLSTFDDAATVSERDLVRLMMTVSDNTAADVLLRAVGLDAVAATSAALGLAGTRVRGGTADALAGLQRDLAQASPAAALEALASTDVTSRISAYDPALASATTAADMTTLLRDVWLDRAAGTESCAFLRRIMAQQVWPHRLAAAFPYDDVLTSGKTGTLGALRHEVGVVEFPGEVPVAVAVLTRSARSERALPGADAAIARVARIAVGALRRVRDSARPA